MIAKVKSRFQLAPESNWILLLMALLLAFSPLSVDVLTPALPKLTGVFEANRNEVTTLIQAFFVGFAFAHVFWGGLSDRFGRLPILTAGIVLYGFATFACLLSESLEVIIFFRFLQGVGAASCAVLCRAVIRDIYGADNATGAMSRMLVYFSPVPILMPLVGGYMISHFAWTAIFWLMLAVSALVMLMVWLLLDETGAVTSASETHSRDIRGNLLDILSNRFFVKNALATMFCFGNLLICITCFPYFLSQDFGFSSEQNGYVFGMIGIALFSGAVIVRFIVPRIGIANTIYTGFSGMTLGWLIVLMLVYTAKLDLPLLALFIVIASFSMALVISLTPGQAMVPFKSNSGSASSIYGILQYGGGTLVAFIANRIAADSLLLCIVTLVISTVSALFFFRVLK